MIVKVRVQSPAGFDWECVWNSEDTIILGFTIDKTQGSVEMVKPDGTIDDPDAMSLVEGVVDEWVFCSDFSIVTAEVDGIPLSEEFIESLYKRLEKRMEDDQ